MVAFLACHKLTNEKLVGPVPTYYSIIHLSVPGGPTRKPWGKYVIVYNKITKDRYLPTGPELTQSAQLYDLNRDGVGDVPFRPVSLYAVVVERMLYGLMLMRSFMVYLMDKAEKIIPSLTPELLMIEKPAKKPLPI